MMAIGTGVAIVCGESVKDDAERKRLMGALAKTHEVSQRGPFAVAILCCRMLLEILYYLHIIMHAHVRMTYGRRVFAHAPMQADRMVLRLGHHYWGEYGMAFLPHVVSATSLRQPSRSRSRGGLLPLNIEVWSQGSRVSSWPCR